MVLRSSSILEKSLACWRAPTPKLSKTYRNGALCLGGHHESALDNLASGPYSRKGEVCQTLPDALCAGSGTSCFSDLRQKTHDASRQDSVATSQSGWQDCRQQVIRGPLTFVEHGYRGANGQPKLAMILVGLVDGLRA